MKLIYISVFITKATNDYKDDMTRGKIMELNLVE